MSLESTNNDVDRLDLPILHVVSRARAGRKLAMVLGIFLLVLPIFLIFVPWQQNVSGAGMVTALDPRDRVQLIPAPVTGRLTRLPFQEGTAVKKGQILAEMEDQDPQFLMTLKSQLQFQDDQISAAHRQLEAYDQQLIQLEEAREAARANADSAIDEAVNKVLSESAKVVSEEAKVKVERQNLDGLKSLVDTRTVADIELQRAQQKYDTAVALLDVARAQEAQARDKEAQLRSKLRETVSKFNADIEKAKADREEGKAKLAEAERKREIAASTLRTQENQTIKAPADGTIQKVHGANSLDLIAKGQPLIEFVPSGGQISAELYVRGIDAPLIHTGRKARLQFEGWPAVQFAGWPSVAVGTFGGVVAFVDPQAQADGTVRVMIVPDPNEPKWPTPPVLRQGVRASGWVQLETVSVGYEIWRQLNAFPPNGLGGVENQKGAGAKGFKNDKKGSKDKP